MTDRIQTSPRTGAFRGETVYTDTDGHGLFTRRPDGSYLQHTGTGQTPRFTSASHLAAWLRRNYGYDDAR